MDAPFIPTARPMFLPKRPRQPTLLERATGIRADLETLAAQTADTAAAADLRAVAGRVDYLISGLVPRQNSFGRRMVAAMRSAIGALWGDHGS